MKHRLVSGFAAVSLSLLLAACTTGRPIAPLPGAAVSQVPPSQQPGAQRDRAYLIFFQEGSDALDVEARRGLDEAAELAKQHPSVRIQVVGFADPEGSSQANVDLSRRRARAVMGALVTRGVAPERIVTIGRGPTSFEQSALESRRVEVSVWRLGMPTR